MSRLGMKMKRSAKPGETPRDAGAVPRSYHHGNLRAALLEAAEELLDARGAAALTLRDVARVAGVSHGAPYHHFASLDDLLAATAQRGFETLGGALAGAAAVADPRERLLHVAQAYVEFACAHPERFRLMFGPLLGRKGAYPALKESAERAFGVVLEAASAHDPDRGADLAIAGWSLSHGLGHLLIAGALNSLALPRKDAETLIRRVTERILG